MLKRHKWIFIRALSVAAIEALFVLSYRTDIQLLEGSLAASRFLGFHLIDPFIALEFLAANHSLPSNLIIGAATVLLLYIIFGRAFCGFVCPYSLVSELAAKVHEKLLKGRKTFEPPKGLEYAAALLFLLLALLSGYLMFEAVNLMAVINRSIIYGVNLAILFAAAMFFVESLLSPMLWCKSLCPIGALYGLLNRTALVAISKKSACNECGACEKACPTPRLLEKKRVTGARCTRCGKCIDSCPNNAIGFGLKG